MPIRVWLVGDVCGSCVTPMGRWRGESADRGNGTMHLLVLRRSHEPQHPLQRL